MPFIDDRRHMSRALELARLGEGFVEPNPMVGAVVVRDGRIVGEGWHQVFGGPHAERRALADAGEEARGATLFVTLEPCCHTGKTPPCTESILEAGVTRVVAATGDPFPKVNGGGFHQLRQAGVVCSAGLLESEARYLLAPYWKLTTTGHPWVIAKWAMTLDGKLATRTGKSQWISGEASREIVHQLRGRVDAILVGAGTVRADNPQLTARPSGARTALRIVLGEIPEGSQLGTTASEFPLLVVVDSQAKARRQAWLQAAGGEVLVTSASSRKEQVAWLLGELGRRQVTNLLVEGGATLLGQFFDLAAVNEVHAFIAPILAGGEGAPSPIAGLGIDSMNDAIRLQNIEVTRVGTDAYLKGRLPAN